MTHCKICNHPERDKIEALIRNGVSANQISKTIPGLTAKMVLNHLKVHMTKKALKVRAITQAAVIPRTVAESPDANEVSFDFNSEIKALTDRVDTILTNAETSQDTRTALVAVKEIRSMLDMRVREASKVGGDSKDVLRFTRSKEWVCLMDFMKEHRQLREEFLVRLRATGSRVEDEEDVEEDA